MKTKTNGLRGRPDFLLLVLTLLLVGFGLVMVFSASSNTAAILKRLLISMRFTYKAAADVCGFGIICDVYHHEYSVTLFSKKGLSSTSSQS